MYHNLGLGSPLAGVSPLLLSRAGVLSCVCLPSSPPPLSIPRQMSKSDYTRRQLPPPELNYLVKGRVGVAIPARPTDPPPAPENFSSCAEVSRRGGGGGRGVPGRRERRLWGLRVTAVPRAWEHSRRVSSWAVTDFRANLRLIGSNPPPAALPSGGWRGQRAPAPPAMPRMMAAAKARHTVWSIYNLS